MSSKSIEKIPDLWKPRHWFERLPTRYALIGLYGTIILAYQRGIFKFFFRERGEYSEPASPLGLFYKWKVLPDDFFYYEEVVIFFQLVFIISSVLWVLHKWLTVTPILTTLSYLFIGSFYVETIYMAASHAGHLVGGVLIIYSAWYFFYSEEIKTSVREGRTFNDHFLPVWVVSLIIFYISSHYTLSGIYKLKNSGFEWGSGHSLQAYVHLLGSDNSIWKKLIVKNINLSSLVQTSVLFLELFSMVAIFSKLARNFIGFSFIVFHIFIVLIFRWDFYAHFFYFLIFFFPFNEIIMDKLKACLVPSVDDA